MSIGVLQLYMGAVLADNTKTVFNRSLIISCEVIGIFCISFPTSNSF